MVVQWIKDNKFVKNKLENWTLVNLDNSYHEFKDNLNWTSDTNRNRFLVQGASHSYKSVMNEYNCKIVATVSSLEFLPSLSHKGFLTLYISLWIILTPHLSTVWDITWVLVPSDTFSGFLWVVVAKASLFKCILHINAVKKVITVHLMRW